jgi:hypothetical protein
MKKLLGVDRVDRPGWEYGASFSLQIEPDFAV